MSGLTRDNRKPSAEQVLVPHSLIETYDKPGGFNKPGSRNGIAGQGNLGSEGTHEGMSRPDLKNN